VKPKYYSSIYKLHQQGRKHAFWQEYGVNFKIFLGALHAMYSQNKKEVKTNIYLYETDLSHNIDKISDK
jgi:hypothetical protein